MTLAPMESLIESMIFRDLPLMICKFRRPVLTEKFVRERDVEDALWLRNPGMLWTWRPARRSTTSCISVPPGYKKAVPLHVYGEMVESAAHAGQGNGFTRRSAGFSRACEATRTQRPSVGPRPSSSSSLVPTVSSVTFPSGETSRWVFHRSSNRYSCALRVTSLSSQ